MASSKQFCKLIVSSFNTNPRLMPRLYFVHCPWSEYSEMYRLQPRQCLALSRLMSLLLDGYEGRSAKALHNMYVSTFGEGSFGVVHSGLLLLKKANYVDVDNNLTPLFYADCDAVEANNVG